MSVKENFYVYTTVIQKIKTSTTNKFTLGKKLVEILMNVKIKR